MANKQITGKSIKTPASAESKGNVPTRLMKIKVGRRLSIEKEEEVINTSMSVSYDSTADLSLIRFTSEKGDVTPVLVAGKVTAFKRKP